MKLTVRIIQVLVGALFIVSGLVKANDPVGLAYKMDEFFIVWNSSLSSGNFFAKDLLIGLFGFLNRNALALSLIIITLEIVSGIALLIGWKKKAVLYLLLALILFFTFLTGYAYFAKHPNGTPKFTNCGCFGDCLPITPGTSFAKDILLLVMIVALLAGQKYIQPLFTRTVRMAILAGSLIVTLLLQWYVLQYLPLVDCLPFKEGNNIAEQMKPPKGAVPDSIAMRFIYVKDGKQYEFAPENLPADLDSYEFKDRIDKLVRKGNAIPRIQGFSLTGKERLDTTTGTSSKQDSTAIVLGLPEAVIGFGMEDSEGEWLEDLKELVASAKQKKVPVFFASHNPDAFRNLFERRGIDVQVFACDFTNIRTAARSDPTFYHLRAGTIIQKYSPKHIEDIAEELKQ